ncbi:hypothetical protein PR202_gb21166 [Eleusine coracana subsp. coracana]|uniref:Uncharacterized protein n=1 Tax=Eleusine coracana subsp. coracana TaxID=191504 RepID=A0AAV5FD96_ELECO|nr:hypothetical protein PR202_gb21166 [Eleusine coracana subsp. coracana]
MAFANIKFRPGDKIFFGTISLVANQHGNLVKHECVAHSNATTTIRAIQPADSCLASTTQRQLSRRKPSWEGNSTLSATPRLTTLVDSDYTTFDLPAHHMDQSDEDPKFFDESRFVAAIGLESESLLDLIEEPSDSESCSSDFHEVFMVPPAAQGQADGKTSADASARGTAPCVDGHETDLEDGDPDAATPPL